MELLGRFAQLASLALDNARLFTQTQEQTRRLELLNEMGKELNRATQVQDILDIAARHARQIVPADEFQVDLLDAAREMVEVIPLDEEAGGIRQGAGQPLPGSNIERVLAEGTYVLQTPLPSGDGASGNRVEMYVPLQTGGQTRTQALEEMREALLIEKMHNVLIKELGVTVGNDEVKKFFDDNPRLFSRPGGVKFRQIFIYPRPDSKTADEAAWAEAEKKINKAQARIRAGESFTKVANGCDNKKGPKNSP